LLRFSTPGRAFHSVSSRLPLSGASHDSEENGIVGYLTFHLAGGVGGIDHDQFAAPIADW
jgi:hypothetical protein